MLSSVLPFIDEGLFRFSFRKDCDAQGSDGFSPRFFHEEVACFSVVSSVVFPPPFVFSFSLSGHGVFLVFLDYIALFLGLF